MNALYPRNDIVYESMWCKENSILEGRPIKILRKDSVYLTSRVLNYVEGSLVQIPLEKGGFLSCAVPVGVPAGMQFGAQLDPLLLD